MLLTCVWSSVLRSTSSSRKNSSSSPHCCMASCQSITSEGAAMIIRFLSQDSTDNCSCTRSNSFLQCLLTPKFVGLVFPYAEKNVRKSYPYKAVFRYSSPLDSKDRKAMINTTREPEQHLHDLHASSRVEEPNSCH